MVLGSVGRGYYKKIRLLEFLAQILSRLSLIGKNFFLLLYLEFRNTLNPF